MLEALFISLNKAAVLGFVSYLFGGFQHLFDWKNSRFFDGLRPCFGIHGACVAIEPINNPFAK